MQYLKSGRSYSNQTWNVSSSIGSSHFIDIIAMFCSQHVHSFKFCHSGFDLQMMSIFGLTEKPKERKSRSRSRSSSTDSSTSRSSSSGRSRSRSKSPAKKEESSKPREEKPKVARSRSSSSESYADRSRSKKIKGGDRKASGSRYSQYFFVVSWFISFRNYEKFRSKIFVLQFSFGINLRNVIKSCILAEKLKRWLFQPVKKHF